MGRENLLSVKWDSIMSQFSWAWLVIGATMLRDVSPVSWLETLCTSIAAESRADIASECESVESGMVSVSEVVRSCRSAV